MMFCGGGETVAWYQNVERMCDLRRRILPLSVRLRLDMASALFLAFSVREVQRVLEFSGVIGRRTPRVARGSEAGGGYGGNE